MDDHHFSGICRGHFDWALVLQVFNAASLSKTRESNRLKWLWAIPIYLIASEIIAAAIRSRKTWGGTPFTSNGCNFLWDGNWHEACAEHDKRYREGGWAVARFKADYGLFLGIARNKNLFAAIVYFIGVRLFGQFAFQYGKKRELITE